MLFNGQGRIMLNPDTNDIILVWPDLSSINNVHEYINVDVKSFLNERYGKKLKKKISRILENCKSYASELFIFLQKYPEINTKHISSLMHFSLDCYIKDRTLFYFNGSRLSNEVIQKHTKIKV